MATPSLLLLAWAVQASLTGCAAKLLLNQKDHALFQKKLLLIQKMNDNNVNVTSASTSLRKDLPSMGLAGRVNQSMKTSKSLRDSFGLIDEPEGLWELRKQVHLAQMQRESKLPGNAFSMSGRVWWQYHHEPSFHCTLGERLGNVGDGGKWLCDPYSMKKNIDAGKPCLVYSIGSHGQFDFEQSVQDLISPKCETHVFDPEKVGTWKVPAHMSYHAYPLGTGTEMVQGVRTKSFGDIVQELGHTGRTIDILKIDCEGCEWQTYEQWLTSGVEIRQILVELHWRGDGRKANELYKFLYDHGYVVFNKEPNTEGCGGDCIEYAFLKLGPGFSKP